MSAFCASYGRSGCAATGPAPLGAASRGALPLALLLLTLTSSGGVAAR